MTNLEKYYNSIVAISNEISFHDAIIMLRNEISFHDAIVMLRKNMTFKEFSEYRKNQKEYDNKIFLQEKQENLEWLNKQYYITSYKELKALYKKNNNAFNGMFGENEDGEIFVIVGDKLIYQNGSYDMLNLMLDKELIIKLLDKDVCSFAFYDSIRFNEEYYFFNKK